MKFVAVFLALIVAAQATSYVVPPYNYWCAHSFHVLPSRSYYCYRIPINRNWCTTRYYANTLVEYPKAEGQGCELEKDNVNDVIDAYSHKLAEARAQIQLELYNGLYAFQQRIDEVHETYLNTFKEYLKHSLHEGTLEYVTRVDAYERELKAIRERAVANYGQSIMNQMNRIENFHNQLLARFRSCLATRATRVEQYKTKMWQRAQQIVAHYRTQLEAIVNKRVAFVTSVFDKLYGDKPKDAKHAEGIAAYKEELMTEINGILAQFELEVNFAVRQFIEKYRCNYKCLSATGSYRYIRKWSSVRCSFPAAPKYSYKMVGVAPFNVDWNGAVFKTLKTCTAAEKKCSFDHQKHLDEITNQVVGYVMQLGLKVDEWKKQVAEWKAAAEKALEDKIVITIPRVGGCGTPTQVEIDAFRQSRREQARAWINQMEQALLAQIDALEARIHAAIDSWKARAIAYINKVVEQFNLCVANKEAKIASYKTALENRRVQARAQLVAWLNKLATDHKAKFDAFWTSAFGQTVKDHYHGCVDQKVKDVIAKFDAYWSKWQPLLIEHYTCGLKCTVVLKTPTLNINYNFRFSGPSISYCKFH